jgi:hypothetical protein
MRPVLDALRADPVLGTLHAEACDWHRAKISELRARPGWDEFRDWLRANAIRTTATITQRDY